MALLEDGLGGAVARLSTSFGITRITLLRYDVDIRSRSTSLNFCAHLTAVISAFLRCVYELIVSLTAGESSLNSNYLSQKSA